MKVASVKPVESVVRSSAAQEKGAIQGPHTVLKWIMTERDSAISKLNKKTRESNVLVKSH